MATEAAVGAAAAAAAAAGLDFQGQRTLVPGRPVLKGGVNNKSTGRGASARGC